LSDAGDEDERTTWLGLAQSLLGGVLLIAHGALGGLLALDLPEWPCLAYVYLVIGPHAARFERVGGAVERVLERLEKLIKAARGFDPRDHGPRSR